MLRNSLTIECQLLLNRLVGGREGGRSREGDGREGREGEREGGGGREGDRRVRGREDQWRMRKEWITILFLSQEAGDFATVAYFVLRNRCPERGK